MTEPRETPRFSIVPKDGAAHRMGGGTAHMASSGIRDMGLNPRTDSLFAIAWRSRWILLICVILSLAAGFVYVRTATPVYTSMSKLYLDYGGPRITAPYEADSMPRTDKYLYTQAELLRSKPILAMAVQPQEQQRMRTFEGVKAPLAFVHRHISVEVGKKDETVSVSFDSPYPAEAAQIVNRVVEAYMASRSEHEQRNSAQVLRILQEDMGRVNEELAQKREELRTFQTNKMPLALGSDQGGGVLQRYLELQTFYTRAQVATMEAESFSKGVKALAENPDALRQFVQVKGNAGSYSAYGATEKAPLETRLVDLNLQVKELSERLLSDHPTVKALASQREEIEATMTGLDQDLVDAAVAAAEQSLMEAGDYEKQLAELYEEQQQQIVAMNTEIVQYQQLRSEVDRLTAYSQTLEQQVREIGRVVNEDVGQLRMAILEPAQPSEAPSKPRRGQAMAMALALGLLLGGGIAVARDMVDQTLRSVDEISSLLGLPALGVIPLMSRRQSPHLRGQRVLLQPDSQEAEAFRTVRTAIFFGVRKDKARTLLVTSPTGGDGKSVLVSNLGIAMASAGQKVIILDADLRKPVQHMTFRTDHSHPCLADVFAGRAKLPEAIQTTKVRGLNLLTCGEVLSNPAEVLNSSRFARLLEYLGKTYDRVLVDAPPVTAVTDAQILGALCDYTILVLRADKTTQRMAQRAIDTLQGVGSRILGVVVNGVHKSDGRYGYYGRYRKPYGNGSNGKKAREGERAAVHAGRPEPAAQATSREEE